MFAWCLTHARQEKLMTIVYLFILWSVSENTASCPHVVIILLPFDTNTLTIIYPRHAIKHCFSGLAPIRPGCLFFINILTVKPTEFLTSVLSLLSSLSLSLLRASQLIMSFSSNTPFISSSAIRESFSLIAPSKTSCLKVNGICHWEYLDYFIRSAVEFCYLVDPCFSDSSNYSDITIYLRNPWLGRKLWFVNFVSIKFNMSPVGARTGKRSGSKHPTFLPDVEAIRQCHVPF